MISAAVVSSIYLYMPTSKSFLSTRRKALDPVLFLEGHQKLPIVDGIELWLHVLCGF